MAVTALLCTAVWVLVHLLKMAECLPGSKEATSLTFSEQPFCLLTEGPVIKAFMACIFFSAPNRKFSCSSHSQRQIHFMLFYETTFELYSQCVTTSPVLSLLWSFGLDHWIKAINCHIELFRSNFNVSADTFPLLRSLLFSPFQSHCNRSLISLLIMANSLLFSSATIHYHPYLLKIHVRFTEFFQMCSWKFSEEMPLVCKHFSVCVCPFISLGPSLIRLSCWTVSLVQPTSMQTWWRMWTWPAVGSWLCGAAARVPKTRRPFV